MKIKIVYFIFLVPNKWIDIFFEQLNMLKALDLYNLAEIYISVISESDEELNKLKILLNDNFPKINLINVYNDNLLYEYPGIKTVYELSENDNDTLILYFHSKGMTSNEHETRKLLFNHTIKNYKVYIQEFINNPNLETAGMLPCKHGFVYYNFFWVRSSYVHNYCSKPETTIEYLKNGRFSWEMWLGYYEYSKKDKVIIWSPIIKYNGTVDHNDTGYYTSQLLQMPEYDYNNFDNKNILFNIM